MIRAVFLLFLLYYSVSVSQQQSYISVSEGENEHLLPSYNTDGSVYVSFQGIVDILGYSYLFDENGRKLSIEFPAYELIALGNNPYLVIRSKATQKTETIQLPTSIHYVDKIIFIPLNLLLDIVNKLSTKQIIIVSPNKLFITENLLAEKNKLWKIELTEDGSNTFFTVNMLKRAKFSISKDVNNVVSILLGNTSLTPEVEKNIAVSTKVLNIDVVTESISVIIKLKLSSGNVAFEIIESSDKNKFIIQFFNREEAEWYEKESKHFRIIYRLNHTHLVNHILSSAENALQKLMPIFNYKPKEKIIINTYDVSDYGFGATTTVPQDYIRLEIEALEPGYEAVPYNERIQWLLSHELVHIVVNDQASNLEAGVRSLFGKVPPEKTQPFTTIYSVIGNFTRYSPRWYHEGIAVFMETWLSGGYGRTLGNFDEMYFRTLIHENKKIPHHRYIETVLSHKSIFLENNYYFYGTRFVSFLAIKYGVNKVIDWYKTYPDQNLTGFIGKFRDSFGSDFDEAWSEFAIAENKFQNENIKILESSNLTSVNKLSTTDFGWVTQPYYDSKTLSIIFGYHHSAKLATLQKFHLLTRNSEFLTSLPTPSMYQVASTAFDENNNLFFFTTNNNKLFRDVWVIDLFTKEKKLLFSDSRIGNITVSPSTHNLWGVQQEGGLSTLVISPYPYRSIEPVFSFDFGEELSHLSVSKSGDKLLGILHKSSGQQSLILIDINNLLRSESLSFKILTSEGSPENPSWSEDGKQIYWNAYTNGVSNLYSYSINDSKITALTNCLTGLFKPIEITPDSLFAFEFSTDGFIPVMTANKPALYLPAIKYFGQKIIDQDPKLYDWVLKDASKLVDQKKFTNERTYNGLENLHLHSLVPVISGFQNQIVLGLFTHISDPLLLQDFIMELGISPFNETPSYPFIHIRLKYDYKQRFYIEYDYNGPDFFDLFNSRKRGMIGSRIKLNHTYYWLYDKPHTIKQEASLSLYTGVEFINDNLVRVSQPDFSVAVYNITSQDLRRTIGSSDYEHGDQFSLTLSFYATQFKNPEVMLNGYLEYDKYALWLVNHNVLHLKLDGGYAIENDKLIQGNFYFGGFGNRGADNGTIRQFRKVFRYPGVPIYNMINTKFIKFMFENDFPPLRVSELAVGNQLINHFDFAVYSQGLVTRSELGNYWINIGAQLDIKLKHWYNLESTFSAGIAKAWSEKMTDWEWFLSIKLLKD